MDIGTVTKKYTNVPKVIPVEIPKKNPHTIPDGSRETGNPEEKPIKIDNWPVRREVPVEK